MRIWLFFLLIFFMVLFQAVPDSTSQNAVSMEKDQTLGEEPEKIEQIFLREEKVLLKKGQAEIET